MGFAINAGKVPQLEDNISIVDFSIHYAKLRDDNVVELEAPPIQITARGTTPVLTQSLSFSEPWDVNDQLVSYATLVSPTTIPLKALKELHGTLKVTLPEKIDVFSMKSSRLSETIETSTIKATLVSHGIDGHLIHITKGGGNLLQIVPRDESGKALAYQMVEDTTKNNGRYFKFKTGRMSSIDIHVNARSKTVSYPVALL
jgi:hypothetical protein